MMTAPKSATKKASPAAGRATSIRPTSPPADVAPGPAATGPGAPSRDTAPRGRGPGRPSTKTKRAERAERLAGDLTAVSVGLMILSPDDALAVGRHAERVAGALAELADQNRLVARMLDGAAKGGALVGVLTAVVPLAAELLANHGLLGALSPLFTTGARMAAEVSSAAGAGAGAAGDVLGGLLATAGGAAPA